MLYLLKRHPIPIRANFEFVLVLTYSFPAAVLRPLLPPGLRLDEWEDHGFVAVAFVQTRQLRPAFLPASLGRSFFLCGYRIFCRYTTQSERELRGLRILRSDTDRKIMMRAGNLLTHYQYRLAQVHIERRETELRLDVQTPDAGGDIRLKAYPAETGESLPKGSLFSNAREARRFAGPMPFTLDYEAETHSIIRIEGVRENWKPRLIPISVDEISFFRKEPFKDSALTLSSCFYIENIEYRWKRGICERLPRDEAEGKYQDYLN